MAQDDLKHILDRLLKKKSKRVITGRVKGGRRTDILTVGLQGRYIKHRDPKSTDIFDIAILPTIKSAIMHSARGKIEVKKRDYKEKVRRRKISTLICLVLDTSSSMVSYHKMVSIQSAMKELMMNAYQARDRVAVVTCFGRTAQVSVPFTSSVDKANKFIETAPYGGTTPLCTGLRRGLETLKAKLRVEPDTRGLLVLATDGSANTPTVPGEDVLDEIKGTCAAISDGGIPLIVVDVNPGGSELAHLIADEASGIHFTAIPPEGAAAKLDIERHYTVDQVIERIAPVIANPDLKGIMLRGVEKGVVIEALDFLDDLSMELRSAAKCTLGCAPDEPEHYCYACKIRYGEGGDVPTSLWTYPIIKMPRKANVAKMSGDIYVRFLQSKGLLAMAHRGIMYLGEPDNVDPSSAAFLSKALASGKYTLGKGTYELPVPARTTLVLSSESTERAPPEDIAACIDQVIDGAPSGSLEERVRKTMYLHEYEVDPIRFEGRVERERRDLVQAMLKARKFSKDVKFEHYDGETIWQIAALFSDSPAFAERLLGAIRLLASKRLASEVSDEDIAQALLQMKMLWTKEGGITPAMGPFAQVAQGVAGSEVIKDRLLPAFVAPEKLKGVLLYGFDADAVKNALKYIQDSGFTIDTVKKCRYGCDPAKVDELCPACMLKREMGELEVVKAPIPLVTLSQEMEPVRLKGKIYIHYVVSPNPLTRAHRGILFIDGIEDLSSETAEIIAEVMASGYNHLDRGRASHRIPSKFLLVGTVRGKDAEIHPMLLEHISMSIEAQPLDQMRQLVRAVRRIRLFSESPEVFAADAERERARTLERILSARGVYEKVAVTDSQLDMVSRVCADMGVEGNISELVIGLVARAHAALRGDSRVTDQDIVGAITNVLPLHISQESMAALMAQTTGGAQGTSDAGG
ncbi:MAG: VWA domain-containing protein [Euryarchaeota archaeon]|nr:VWA domain-containing protein [Euryarchaeota archaeon]